MKFAYAIAGWMLVAGFLAVMGCAPSEAPSETGKSAEDAATEESQTETTDGGDMAEPEVDGSGADEGDAAREAQVEEVKKETEEALKAISGLIEMESEEFRGQFQDQMQNMAAEMEELRTTLGQMSDESRNEMQQAWKDLEQQQQEAYEKLGELQGTNQQSWDDVKQKFSEAFQELNQTLEEFNRQLREQMNESAETGDAPEPSASAQ